MGSCGSNNGDGEELKKALNVIKENAPPIVNNCVTKKSEINNKKEILLKERAEKVEQADKSNKEQLQSLLKEYNIKELNIDKEYIENEVERLHSLWNLGIDLSGPVKNETVAQLEKRAKKCSLCGCCVTNIANKVKNYTPSQFLKSEFGAPLRAALEKQGMNKQILIDTKNELINDRKKRREEERNKYNIDVNEFPPDDEFDINEDELSKIIFNEYKDEIEHPFENIFKKNKL